jgi:SpoVK/Ycf46/Vps4 family AAA+-type ATPase
MDKIQWLKGITEQNPTDSKAWYFLGKEYMEASEPIQAIMSFTEGLKHCQDSFRTELLEELSRATSLMQGIQGQTGEKQGEMDRETEVLEPKTAQVQRVKVFRGLEVIPGGKSEESHAEQEDSQVTFDDVAGLEDLKKTIRLKIISPFYNQGLFAKFRKKAGGGVLLYGPPGCGKTYIARATAGECKANFINVHITDILDPYIGVSEQNLKDLFDKARYQKPSIMFFDEIDAIGFNRSKSSSHLRGLVDTFLSQMEGIETTTDQVLVIGATNMPWDVDNALKRPGRFDRMIFVAPPDEEARKQIFILKLKGRMIDVIDYEQLAKMTKFYSGADIENVCEQAAEIVLEEILTTGNERPIAMKDVEKAIEASQPSTLEWLRTAKNFVKYANQSGLYNEVEHYLKKHGKSL